MDDPGNQRGLDIGGYGQGPTGTGGYGGYGGHQYGGARPEGTQPASSQSASDIYAALTQEQWQNYVSVFVPIENQLIDYATDPNQVNLAMDAAHQNVEGAYSQQQGALERGFKGLGVTLTPEQKTSQTRQFGLSQALADVQGQNVARDLTLARQQSILGNPAPTTASIAQQATALGS